MLTPDQYQPFKWVRANRLITVTLFFMATGTLSELLLLEHYEDEWQLVPIVLIGASLLLFLILHLTISESVFKIFNILMIACIFSGFLGVWFHLKANIEFESELHPTASGWSLMIDSLSGALPALAPGSMIAFGLVGYLYTILTIKKP